MWPTDEPQQFRWRCGADLGGKDVQNGQPAEPVEEL
jgi:hypothetical protein